MDEPPFNTRCAGPLADAIRTGSAAARNRGDGGHLHRRHGWCFSCGWHITRDGQDVYTWKLKALEATRRVFASDTRWTVVRGSRLEEGISEGLPVSSRHVGDPILRSNLTRRVDFALFMVQALEDDDLVQEAPAIVSRQSPSALAHRAQPPAVTG
jgi:hypothetical protein